MVGQALPRVFTSCGLTLKNHMFNDLHTMVSYLVVSSLSSYTRHVDGLMPADRLTDRNDPISFNLNHQSEYLDEEMHPR
jgi:hypothetical protein